MLVSESRPRTLRWTHAGPLLYGDWGTSRLYVLGLAFLYTAHSSVVYLAAIGILMLAVSWAYTVVCRSFPDGGGVYSAARQLNPTLSVIGATLLLSGYIMTAAISVVEAFHYFGVPDSLTLPLSALAILLIGAVNWLGAKSAGRFAFVVATAALLVGLVMGVLCLPYFFEGVRSIDFTYLRTNPAWDSWVAFTNICLALAGVEAVANMTGLMKKPVDKTAKRTIWPVTIEVVLLNMVFGIALTGLSFSVAGVSLVDTVTPHAQQIAEGVLDADAIDRVHEYQNAAMKVIATEEGTRVFGPGAGLVFGKVAGIVFGLLLLSATNTAVMATVSVLFAMGQDRELPKPLTRLNYSGVPWVGLIVAVLVPIGVVAFERDVTVLAKLYVLGVCGAITVTMLSCAVNKKIEISTFQRGAIWAIGLFLLAVSVTIGITQLESTAFSGGLIVLVLGTRFVLKAIAAGRPAPMEEPEAGWLVEVRDHPVKVDPAKPAIMLAARGRYQSDFAVDLARRRGATLYTLFVRPIRVMDLRPGQAPKVEDDPGAAEALGTTVVLAKQSGVDCVPIYVTSPTIAEEILDYTVTHGCDTLIMGKSRRSLFSRAVAGDVVADVALHLPDEVALITRSPDTPHVARGGANRES